MGLLDFLRGTSGAQAPSFVERSEPTSKAEAVFADIVARRRYAFGIESARSIPAVARARVILASTAASFQPLTYRNGQAMPSQPRLVTNPMAFGNRYTFVEQTMLSLIDYGCAPWRVYGRDEDPSRSVVVLPHEEMAVEWARRPITRQYRWNGVALGDDDLIHIDIDMSAGELHGHGALSRSLEMLYPVWEAEQFAVSFFTSGGVPEVVLKAAQDLTHDEAEDLKKLWIGAANTTVRIAGSGVEPQFPGVDPQRAQLQEARAFGATVAATVFGIPAAMLHVQTSGATITYTNPSGAMEEVVKTTLAPRYLAPIETAWSALLPSPQSVRFDLADMQRADIKARFDLYAVGIDKGVMTPEEARAYEGWGPIGTADEAVHQFDAPLPPVEPSIPAAEVKP